MYGVHEVFVFKFYWKYSLCNRNFSLCSDLLLETKIGPFNSFFFTNGHFLNFLWVLINEFFLFLFSFNFRALYNETRSATWHKIIKNHEIIFLVRGQCK